MSNEEYKKISNESSLNNISLNSVISGEVKTNFASIDSLCLTDITSDIKTLNLLATLNLIENNQNIIDESPLSISVQYKGQTWNCPSDIEVLYFSIVTDVSPHEDQFMDIITSNSTLLLTRVKPENIFSGIRASNINSFGVTNPCSTLKILKDEIININIDAIGINEIGQETIEDLNLPDYINFFIKIHYIDI